MKRNKRAISLIVLVVTIIVLAILASTAIIAITNYGIINISKQTVKNYDLTQVQQMASVAWSEALVDNSLKTPVEYEEYIRNYLKESGVSNSYQYEIDASSKGVTLTDIEESYKDVATVHPDQSESKAIGLDYKGDLVNMDLWAWEDEGDYINLTNKNPETGESEASAYLGKIEDGKIQSEVPQYIKLANGQCKRVTTMYRTFYNLSGLEESPAIPNTVTDMTRAYDHCTGLIKAPVIPEGVKNLSWTFYYCENLNETPTLPSSVRDLTATFACCVSMTEAPVIPKGVTSLPQTFASCLGLTKAPVIPEGVTSLVDTFIWCSNLKEVPALPSTVTNMYYTFSDCTNLENAPAIPKSVTNMAYTFVNCTNLKEAPAIPEGVIIMAATFGNCSNLTKAPIIPSTVTNMWYAFTGCTNLTGTILINAKEITSFYRTFYNITNTITVSVPENSTTYTNLNSEYENVENIIIQTITPKV